MTVRVNCEYSRDARIVYSRDSLLQLQNKCNGECDTVLRTRLCDLGLERGAAHGEGERIPLARQKKRGKKGGVRHRLRKRSTRPPLPSVILANVRSLRNKHNKLIACTKYLHEYREASLLCITESWLDDTIDDSCLAIDGFSGPFRLDRSPELSEKEHGGGVCVYVSNKWCSDITVKNTGCSKDIEFISLSLRPFYLPREFGRIFLTVVYIPPDAHYRTAADVISDIVQGQESVAPDAPKFVLGDFNQCVMSNHLPHYEQYVDCNTRKDKILDKCFGNIPKAYKAVKKAPLSNSDHNVVHLLPSYKTKLKSSKPITKTVKQWNPDSEETLKGEFEATDWDIFFNENSISETADVVGCYIQFNREKTIPTKTIQIYPNNHPWVSKELKQTLALKGAAFAKNDVIEGKRLESILTSQISECKRQYKDKVESQFQCGDLRQAWRGIKTMAGASSRAPSSSLPIPSQCQNAADFSNQLNSHFARFEGDFSSELATVTQELKRMAQPSDAEMMEIKEEEVQRVFRQLHVRKAAGPDGVCGRLLSTCSSQLAGVFTRLFNCSLESGIVPTPWKQSVIHPLPKKARPTTMKDFRPISLTSIIVKCMERVILSRLLQQAGDRLDPLQFAYRRNKSVEDAVISMLNLIYSHLDKPKSFARVLFADFSAAFDTVKPHMMARKLMSLSINPTLCLWLLDFLTNRQQSVRVNNTFSDNIVKSVGTPQGSVVSPVLYILFTNDCCSDNPNQFYVKFADDTALVDISNSDTMFVSEANRFVSWCDENSLCLNVSKTKEMLIDFRTSGSAPEPLVIDGQEVDRVESYTYLGTVIDSKLSFTKNTDNIYSKAQSRLYMLRKLRSFGVDKKVLKMFYFSFIESLLTFSFLAWFNNLNVQNSAKLNRVLRHSQKVVGDTLPTLSFTYEKRAVRKARRVSGDTSHFLSQYIRRLPSGRRFEAPPVRTERHKKSFVPTAVRLLNGAF